MHVASDSEYIIRNAPMEGIADVPARATMALEYALQRYLAIHQVTSGVIPLKQVLKDRTEYIHLYTPGENGQAILQDSKQIEFMHLVTGHPRAWCAAWLYRDQIARIADGEFEGEDPWAAVEEAYNSAVFFTSMDEEENGSALSANEKERA